MTHKSHHYSQQVCDQIQAWWQCNSIHPTRKSWLLDWMMIHSNYGTDPPTMQNTSSHCVGHPPSRSLESVQNMSQTGISVDSFHNYVTSEVFANLCKKIACFSASPLSLQFSLNIKTASSKFCCSIVVDFVCCNFQTRKFWSWNGCLYSFERVGTVRAFIWNIQRLHNRSKANKSNFHVKVQCCSTSVSMIGDSL